MVVLAQLSPCFCGPQVSMVMDGRLSCSVTREGMSPRLFPLCLQQAMLASFWPPKTMSWVPLLQTHNWLHGCFLATKNSPYLVVEKCDVFFGGESFIQLANNAAVLKLGMGMDQIMVWISSWTRWTPAHGPWALSMPSCHHGPPMPLPVGFGRFLWFVLALQCLQMPSPSHATAMAWLTNELRKYLNGFCKSRHMRNLTNDDQVR